MRTHIYIPSYDRIDTLMNTTLKLLTKHNIDKAMITIFVETEEMMKEYNTKLNFQYMIVVTNTKGIMEKRNFLEIYAYEASVFLNNSLNVLFIDDDIQEIYDLEKPVDNLKSIIDIGFREARNTGYNVWGVSSFHNPFYMSKDISHSNKYICGAFFGQVIDTKNECILCDIDHGEDIQRSLEAFIRDDGIIRLNWIGLKTDYFPDSGITKYCGGVEARKKEMINNCQYLAARYGSMCSYKENKWGATIRFNPYYKN